MPAICRCGTTRRDNCWGYLGACLEVQGCDLPSKGLGIPTPSSILSAQCFGPLAPLTSLETEIRRVERGNVNKTKPQGRRARQRCGGNANLGAKPTTPKFEVPSRRWCRRPVHDRKADSGNLQSK